jgi:hypothetical protein
VLFGLFHGLVYLPVLLSWIGPAAYSSADRRYKDEDAETGDSKGPAVQGQDNLAMSVSVSVDITEYQY